MAKIDYQALYQLQDQVLEIMFRDEVSFYLTGGTCLHRFYFQKEYRLRSFPVELLDTLSAVDESFLTDMKTNYPSSIHSFLDEIG